jgi:iron complex outermembrane receptor protein
MRSIFKLNTLSIALLVATGASTNVLAEGAKKTIEVIQVTAQKRSQSINEVPMAISAFNADDMNEMGLEDTTDLAAVVPGFNFSETAFGPPVYTLRGVGFNEASPQATSTVGVYIDEVAVPFPIMTKGAMIDMERVEILKGPQGTLYGRNSTAGAVNYIAAKPSDSFESGFKGSVGSYETFSTEGFITGALSDTINGRFAAKSIKSGKGWQESISRDDTLGEQDKLAARLSLDIQLGVNTQAYLKVSHVTDKSDSITPQLVDANYRFPLEAGYPSILSRLTQDRIDASGLPGEDSTQAEWTRGKNPSVNHETNRLSLKLTHDFDNGISFTALSGISEFKDTGSEYERGGTDGLALAEMLAASEARYPGSGENILKDFNKDKPLSYVAPNDYITQNGTIDAFSQEFRLSQTLDHVAWIAGVYFSKSEVVYNTTQDWSAGSKLNLYDGTHPAAKIPFGLGMLNNYVKQDTDTKAVFANADWFINDQLTITTGIRFAEDTADYKGCSKDTAGDGTNTFGIIFAIPVDQRPAIGECISIIGIEGLSQGLPISQGLLEDTLKEDSTSWRLAANYALDKYTSVYASYSRGFKAGSFPSLSALSADQLRPVVQEQIDAYEIGFKANILDGSAQINGAAFYYDYKDKQLLTKAIIPVFDTAFLLGNVPESIVSGVELDLTWLPTDNLTIIASAGYLNTEIKKGQGFSQVGQFADFKGSHLPFSPKVQANLMARYEWGISDDYEGMFAIDMAYTGETYHDFISYDDNTLYAIKYEGTSVEVELPVMPYEFDQDFKAESYIITNARLGIIDASGTWKAYLWVRNLTDEFYVSTTVQNSEMQSRYTGMPRTIGLSFEYLWE